MVSVSFRRRRDKRGMETTLWITSDLANIKMTRLTSCFWSEPANNKNSRTTSVFAFIDTLSQMLQEMTVILKKVLNPFWMSTTFIVFFFSSLTFISNYNECFFYWITITSSVVYTITLWQRKAANYSLQTSQWKCAWVTILLCSFSKDSSDLLASESVPRNRDVDK